MTSKKNHSSLNGHFGIALDANQALRLVRAKAAKDALFRPLRDSNDRAWQHGWTARRRYDKCGTPWRSNAADAASAKEAERTIKVLTRHNLVRRFQPRAMKTLCIAITPLGDVMAGALLGWDVVDDALVFCTELHRLTTEAGKPPQTWVREVTLNDGRGWGDGNSEELWVVEMTALAALSRRLAESNADGRRRVYYRLTLEGVRAVKASAAAIPIQVEPLRDGEAIYWQTFDAAIADLHAKSDREQELGEIPLPCSSVVAV